MNQPPLIHYRRLLLGAAAIASGFALMALAPSADGMGVCELTIGPIIVVVGFALVLSAILPHSS